MSIRRLAGLRVTIPIGERMAIQAADPEVVATPVVENDSNDPVTLHRIMQMMIGEGLRERYRPAPKLSHELFVLLLQLKEQERKKKRRAAPPQAGRRRRPACSGDTMR